MGPFGEKEVQFFKYCERCEFANAWATISNAEHFVKRQRDKHLHALY